MACLVRAWCQGKASSCECLRPTWDGPSLALAGTHVLSGSFSEEHVTQEGQDLGTISFQIASICTLMNNSNLSAKEQQ